MRRIWSPRDSLNAAWYTWLLLLIPLGGSAVSGMLSASTASIAWIAAAAPVLAALTMELTRGCSGDGPHVDLGPHAQGVLPDIHFFDRDCRIFCSYAGAGPNVRLYEVVGQTYNPREFHGADAVVLEGQLVTAVDSDEHTLSLQHPMAGRIRRLDTETSLDEPALVLERIRGVGWDA